MPAFFCFCKWQAAFFERFLQMWYGQGKSLKTARRWEPILHTLFVMTRNAVMVVEGTFEPCKKGTNDPEVQRSFRIWSNVSSLNMPSFKIRKSKKRFFTKKAWIRCWAMWRSIKLVWENLPKIIILTEHLASIGVKNQKIRPWFCEKTFDGYYGQVRW